VLPTHLGLLLDKEVLQGSGSSHGRLVSLPWDWVRDARHAAVVAAVAAAAAAFLLFSVGKTQTTAARLHLWGGRFLLGAHGCCCSGLVARLLAAGGSLHTHKPCCFE